MSDEIKVGDVVTYRGAWGNYPPKKAVIVSLEVTMEPHEKEGGLDCQSCSLSLVKANRVVFGLDDGHWCYSDQIVL